MLHPQVQLTVTSPACSRNSACARKQMVCGYSQNRALAYILTEGVPAEEDNDKARLEEAAVQQEHQEVVEEPMLQTTPSDPFDDDMYANKDLHQKQQAGWTPFHPPPSRLPTSAAATSGAIASHFNVEPPQAPVVKQYGRSALQMNYNLSPPSRESLRQVSQPPSLPPLSLVVPKFLKSLEKASAQASQISFLPRYTAIMSHSPPLYARNPSELQQPPLQPGYLHRFQRFNYSSSRKPVSPTQLSQPDVPFVPAHTQSYENLMDIIDSPGVASRPSSSQAPRMPT